MQSIITSFSLVLLLGSAVASAAVLPLAEDFSRPQPGEQLPGGATSARHKADRHSFSQPSANISLEKKLDFRVGNAVFDKIWVTSPSSTTASDGLGPLYNARSCVRCHRNNGRGIPTADTPASYPPNSSERTEPGLFLRLSIPPQNEQQQRLLDEHRQGFIAEPTYGSQLQTFAWVGGRAEARLEVSYEEIPLTFADGETIKLRAPSYHLSNPGYGNLHPDTMVSPRLTPALIGMGLLEAIEEQDLLALEDPEDRDGDGISGRANRVWDRQQNKVALGRFGWKAGNPTLEQQNNAALSGDIGIGNWLFPDAYGDCTQHQPACRQQPNGNTELQDGLEASRQMTDLLLLYTRHIAVPRRNSSADPSVLAGKQVFYQAGCVACHRPAFVTGKNAQLPEQSEQTIWPYSDLLLHDMGAGLADNRPEYAASGLEWRTPPLWGIGLTEAVTGQAFYLHDGRARSLMEAILWHGGEAQASQQTVLGLDKTERDNLIRFLESL
ncbi:c-type cytochrome [Aestuariirhabdus sp. Z084]|uniref:di-heme oxidoreductase family protein n=1 Tax=Aestuariirhabdus haliotis TaxID=2918751 RepID=UPI00201B362A|nr:di-heme oxidoredictase family protein [Aestuariirhabdus haliotis]MCL6415164.1 c-type cytochrome [Aestuariirhabdus haliotis]MCL6420039.1 c-type cytochrome [Aestuariirhabdus haliotis]